MKAKYIQSMRVLDPDTDFIVDVVIFKNENGGMFGVDSSFLENTSDPVFCPFTGQKMSGPDFDED